MKRQLFGLLLIVLFFSMLAFPKEVCSGASDGLLLWFQVVLPTLLPFLFLSNLLIATNTIEILSRVLGPIFSRLFRTSDAAGFAILSGFLCGYPIGAKITADLVKSGHISRSEGCYLLSFCNNTSPAFLTSYLVLKQLQDESLLFPTILIWLIAPIFSSFLFRLYYHPDFFQKQLRPHTHPAIQFQFSLFDQCILNSLETIAKIGGYIMLFSVLIALFQIIPTPFSTLRICLLSTCEITNGIQLLSHSAMPFSQKYIALLSLTSFGGLCSVAQTNSMLSDSGIPFSPYIIEKLVTTCVTSLCSYLYLYIR